MRSATMNVAAQAIQRPGKTLAVGLGLCATAFVLLLSALLYELGMSPAPILLAVAGAALLAVAFRYPLACTGAFLAFMPVYPLTFLIAKFFAPSAIGHLEGIDRVVLLLLTCILWWRNGVKLIAPDWFLIAAVGITILRLPLDGSMLQTASDFGFIIAYAAGRVAGMTSDRESIWAKRAVWIFAAVSVLGLTEVFGFGEAPRTLLYLSVAESSTVNGVALGPPFHAGGFAGLRESSTMLGPLHFGPMCMVALIIWWAYSRRPIPGIMIATGLVCSITRSAWVGAALAIFFLAIVMGQRKRLFTYVSLALALFVAAVPFLGLSDYLAANKSGSDVSLGQHQDSLLEGLTVVASHPLGLGSANIGRQAEKSNESATYFESAYLTLAGEYGIPTILCLLGFLLAAFRVSLRQRTQLGYTAAAVVIGFGAVLMFASLHDVFPLACWLWFPVGLAVTSSSKQSRGRMAPGPTLEP
ncbi:MAG: O-antigen ligase family protein [Terracidiphilus sp.]